MRVERLGARRKQLDDLVETLLDEDTLDPQRMLDIASVSPALTMNVRPSPVAEPSNWRIPADQPEV